MSRKEYKSSCYHLNSLETQQNLKELPLELKKVSIEAKSKRGRKPNVSKDLQKKFHYYKIK